MINIASHYSDLEINLKFYGHYQRQQSKEEFPDDKLSCLQLRDHIASILTTTLKTEENNELKATCIWMIYTLIVDQIYFKPK
jgi:hypothetical protein